MPLYEYACPNQHHQLELRRHEARAHPLACLACGCPMTPLFSAHHRQPDGLYSHDPNLGDPAKFERNLAGIETLKAKIGEKKDRGHPR